MGKRFVASDRVYMSALRVLMQQFTRRGIVDRNEPIIITAGRDDPLLIGRPGNMFDQTLLVFVFQFQLALSAGTLENLQSCRSLQVIDVADFASASHCQSLAVG